MPAHLAGLLDFRAADIRRLFAQREHCVNRFPQAYLVTFPLHRIVR
jgi:hypothetical protein